VKERAPVAFDYKTKLKFGCRRLDPELWERFKEFRSAGNQSDLDADEAALQKRFWNLMLSKRVHFSRGLDLFAGVGYSSWIYSKCCDHLTLIENDPQTYSFLTANMASGRDSGEVSSSIDTVFGDNLDFLKDYSGEKFDLVDIDPFGSPIPQLNCLDKIFDSGVVAVTSGTIMRIARGLDKTVDSQYSGHGAIRWAIFEYLPELAKTYDLKLEAFYLYPSSLRAIFTRNFDLPANCFPGEKLLGWFRG